MTKRIFQSIFFVALSIFLCSIFLFLSVLYNYFSDIQFHQLKIQTELAAQGIKAGGTDYLKDLSIQDYRITWIHPDGHVLYDNILNAEEMENHFQREEIKEALENGNGQSIRYSSTLTQKFLYNAKQLQDGSVLRLSISQSTLIPLIFGMLQPILILFFIAFLMSLFLASRLSQKIVQPLNDLNLDNPSGNKGYEELSPLLQRLEYQQCEIKRQKNALLQKETEFDTLTSCMTEGIVLLNKEGIILSINSAAMSLFETDRSCIGKNIQDLNLNTDWKNIFGNLSKEENYESYLNKKNKTYQLIVNPVSSNQIISGAVMLLIDITEKEKSEELRKEFTANVSHELKTPLHTISGYAELLMNNLVKPEDIAVFSEKIYRESQRMISLIEDIIKLSHLDEGAEEMEWEEIDLCAVAEETVRLFDSKARQSHIDFQFKGQPAVIYGIRHLLQEIIYNLCDNSIKYNRANGSVSVEVKNEDDFILLSVSDTGIGIPIEHQNRIFERFYRVDKSHSKEIGGTGLGLSIVKHAAKLHHAKIELHSIADKGTEIKIKFPKHLSKLTQM